jgi:ubiquinone/menaquinone biosynthesis C-methylase UbiE
MSSPSAATHDSFWDRSYRAGDHLEHWEPPAVPPELVAALASGLVRGGQTALDVGCGTGAEAVFLAGAGVSVLGVDASPVALALAARRAAAAGVTVDWRLGDATRLPVADKAVDLVLDRGCLHVIARRRRKLYAKEVARVLRPGGALLLRGAREDDEEAGLIGISRREATRLFAARGFTLASFSPLTMAARASDLPAVQAIFELVH